jgi:hypothetical protein
MYPSLHTDRIKPQFCLLNDKNKVIDAHFLQKQQINRNSYLVRFGMHISMQLCLTLISVWA